MIGICNGHEDLKNSIVEALMNNPLRSKRKEVVKEEQQPLPRGLSALTALNSHIFSASIGEC